MFKAGYAAGLLLKNLKAKSHQWWYFLDHPKVPPDNNRSERALRLAVTKRTVCGRSRSMEGFADTANLLTVIQTCRAQGRSALEFFRQAIAQSIAQFAAYPIAEHLNCLRNFELRRSQSCLNYGVCKTAISSTY